MNRPVIWLWCLLSAFGLGAGINHLVLSGNRIVQKYDTPFLMREPDNLPVFLEQINYSEYVEKAYLELLRAREKLVRLLHVSVAFGDELLENAKCVMDYYWMEKRMQYLEITSDYLKRLNLPVLEDDLGAEEVCGEPRCLEAAQMSTSPKYEHLEASFDSASVDQEDENDLNDLANVIRQFATKSLRLHPHSWKSYTMGSYYWRLKGHGKEAIECARLGVAMAPDEFKDIPLLCLGTTLISGGHFDDAVVFLKEAVAHAPNVAENHLALASAFVIKHEYPEALHHFDEAERLDANVSQKTLPVRNFVGCLSTLSTKRQKMYSYVDSLKLELEKMKQLKAEITQKHEKLLQQQVPLNARNLEDSRVLEELSRRGQYCSARPVPNSEESVLFCDFYSDTHMRLESKEVDIETLERKFRRGNEAVMLQVATQLSQPIQFGKVKAAKPHGDKD